MTISHDDFVRALGKEHLIRGWIVYAAHVKDFPDPPKIGRSKPNLYMVRSKKIRIIEVATDASAVAHIINQLKDFLSCTKEIYLAMCAEQDKAKKILKDHNLSSIEAFSPKTFKKIFED